VVDAEALEVVDGGHRYRLPAAPSTSIKMKSLPYIRDAFLVCQCQCQWWRVSARLLYFSKSNDGDTLGPITYDVMLTRAHACSADPLVTYT
jgi:hypothetical protein